MSTSTLPAHKNEKPSDGRLRPVSQHRSFASLRAIGALMLREVSTSNGRSAGGYFWAVAEPVGGIALLTIIFSFGFRSPPLGTNFAIFYSTGIIPLTVYMAMSSKVAQSITYSKALLTYPAVTFVDALVARVIVNAITQFLVAYIVFLGIVMLQETRTDPQVDGIMLAMIMAMVFGVGVGALNCFLISAFPLWGQLWSIMMRPLFLVSCIFFIYDDVPDKIQHYLWFNPLVHVVGQMRKSFYPSYSGDYVSPAYVFAVGLVLLMVGLALLIRYHRDLQNS